MVRKLYRSRENRIVAGVCAGLAQYFELDPTLVRLGMAALIVLGGGFLFYIIAWLIVPQEPLIQ